jgi:hypothetical protein
MSDKEQRINHKMDMHGTKYINIKDLILALYRDLMVVTDPATKDYIQENIRILENFSSK